MLPSHYSNIKCSAVKKGCYRPLDLSLLLLDGRPTPGHLRLIMERGNRAFGGQRHVWYVSSLRIVISDNEIKFFAGVYVVLFVLAVWAMNGREGPSRKGLRIVTWLLYSTSLRFLTTLDLISMPPSLLSQIYRFICAFFCTSSRIF
jgi:hypothetical protein